jgi:hypothetical protein
MLFLDFGAMAIFFSDMGRREYWSNVVCAGACFFLSTGLSMMLTTGAMTLGGAGAAGASVDAWAASMISWHSYLMLAMTGYALLKNTVLAPERGDAGGRRGRRG